MERLTEWDEYGNADIIALSDMMPEIYAELSFSETNDLTDVLNRLAAYEDTGLSPEEITDLQRAWDMYGGEEGITALLATPPNDPLTLEELRGMPLHEWCWIERKMKPGYYCKFRSYIDEEVFRCGWPGSDIFSFDCEEYGKTWTAYRRKPEDGTP